MNKLILLLIICFTSCMDPFFDKEIKLTENIYLIHDAGIAGYGIARKTGEDYFEVILGPEIIEVASFEKKLLVKRIDSDSISYYRINLHFADSRDSVVEISEETFNNFSNSENINILYNDNSLNRN